MTTKYNILGSYKDPHNGNVSFCVDVQSRKYGKIRFSASRSELYADTDLRKNLLNSGLYLPDDKEDRCSLFRAFRKEVERSNTINVKLNTGWNENKTQFIIPDRTFGPNAKNTVHVNSINGIVNYPRISKAEIESWKSEVKKITDHSFLAIFSLSIPFIGPIIGYEKAPGEIPIFNFYGASSSGKSYLLKIATTIFGNDDPQGSLVNFNFTETGMEETLSECNHLFLALDEEGLSADEIVKARRKMAMRWTGARSRTRSKHYAGHTRFSTFRVPIAASSNSTSEELNATQRDRPLAVRWLDIPGSVTADGDIFAETFTHKNSVNYRSKLLKDVLAEAMAHQRHVGLKYLKDLTDPSTSAVFRRERNVAYNKFIERHGIGTERQQMRILEKFAHVYSVASALPTLQLVPWTKRRGQAAVEAIFARYKKSNPKGFGNGYAVLALLRALVIEKHLFPRIGSVVDIGTFSGIGLNSYSNERKIILVSRVLPNVQRQLVSNLGVTVTELESLLKRRGLLFLNPQGKATVSRSFKTKGSKRHRFLPIDYKKLCHWLNDFSRK